MGKVTLTFIFLLFTILLSAQSTTDEKPFKEKLYTGGQFGATFGTYTNVMISPMIGARFSEKVYAGLGIEYQYTKDKQYSQAKTYNQFGGRLFSQYNFAEKLYAHAELAGLSMEYYNLTSKTRNFVPFFYLGGGYRQKLSPKSFISFRVVFDVLQHKNSPYSAWEPIFSIGFGVGI